MKPNKPKRPRYRIKPHPMNWESLVAYFMAMGFKLSEAYSRADEVIRKQREENKP